MVEDNNMQSQNHDEPMSPLTLAGALFIFAFIIGGMAIGWLMLFYDGITSATSAPVAGNDFDAYVNGILPWLIILIIVDAAVAIWWYFRLRRSQT